VADTVDSHVLDCARFWITSAHPVDRVLIGRHESNQRSNYYNRF